MNKSVPKKITRSIIADIFKRQITNAFKNQNKTHNPVFISNNNIIINY